MSNMKLAAVLLPAIAIGGGCTSITDRQDLLGESSVSANDYISSGKDGFTRSLYAGAGLGLSRLDPDTSEVEGWDPNDRVNNGGQVTLGVDLFKQLSVELHSADLGSAGLSPTGRINYHINGASALVYAGGNRHRFLRRGLTGYARVGYGALDNSAVGPVPFDKVNANHFLLGAGVEYMTRIGLGARAELISFDKDVQYGQLALIYRLGKKRSIPARITQVAATPVPAAALPATPEAVAYAAPAVIQKSDSCFIDSGLLDSIVFHTDSAQLTGSAAVALNEIAHTLAQCKNEPMLISAHTDSIGDYEYNQDLSARRAMAVYGYLRNRGINTKRLLARAYGESNPIDSNDTASGRQRNRRVELIAR